MKGDDGRCGCSPVLTSFFSLIGPRESSSFKVGVGKKGAEGGWRWILVLTGCCMTSLSISIDSNVKYSFSICGWDRDLMDWIIKIEKLLFLLNRLRGFSTPCFPLDRLSWTSRHSCLPIGLGPFSIHVTSAPHISDFEWGKISDSRSLFFLSKQLFSPFFAQFSSPILKFVVLKFRRFWSER